MAKGNDAYKKDKKKNNKQKPLTPVKEQEEEQDEQVADGRPKGLFVGMGEDGLSNIQIDKVMRKYPEYLGTIARDQIKSIIIPKIKPKSRPCYSHEST